MPRNPNVLIPHQQREAQTLKTELEENIPDIDLTITDSRAETAEHIESAEILIATIPSDEQLEQGENIRWIVIGSSGYDHLDLDRLRENDIMLTNGAGLSAQPMAETVLGYILVFERRLLKGIQQKHNGTMYQNYKGMGILPGKTVGIVGVGRNGGRVAEVSKDLGMNVIGTKRTPETANDAVDEIYGPEGLDKVLSRSDYVVVSCSLNEQTRGLIGMDEFRTMKDDAIIINIARPAVVKEEDLISALQLNVIDGAGLDQIAEESRADSALWNLSNVVITPSTAGQFPSKEYYYKNRVAPLFIENYERYVNSDFESMENRVV